MRVLDKNGNLIVSIVSLIATGTQHTMMHCLKFAGLGWAKEVDFLLFIRFPVLNFGYCCISYIPLNRSMPLPNNSICSSVVEELKKYLPGYKKGDQNVFSKIQDKLDNAIRNASRLEQFHRSSETTNPSTNVHSLVEYLRDLREQKSGQACLGEGGHGDTLNFSILTPW